MHRKILALGLVLSVCLLAAVPAFAQNSAKSALAIPVTGTVAPSATSGPLSGLGTGTFNGTFNIQQFVNQNGTLTAVGTLVGTVTGAGGQVTQVVLNNVSTAVTAAQASCSILSLTLGPLHLDLLGLVVDLNQIKLNITAVPGAGNLLGNLLCDVANLLNSNGGVLTSLTNLLNQLIGSLRL